MPTGCAHANCRNVVGKFRGVTFHKFPREPEKLSRWTKFMKRHESWVPKYYDRVCSVHFSSEHFDRTGQTVRLRDNAEPSLPHLPWRFPKSRKLRKSVNRTRKRPSTQNDSTPPPEDNSEPTPQSPSPSNSEPQETICNTEEQPASPRNVLQNESEPVQQCSISSNSKLVQTANSTGKRLASSQNASLFSAEKEGQAPEQWSLSTFHTYAGSNEDFKLKWQQAERRAETLSRKLRTITRTAMLLKKSISSLKEELKESNLLKERLQQKLDTVEAFPYDLFQLAGSSGYTEEQKNFALTLHMQSPKAYKFLRTKISLPSTRTLRRWISEADDTSDINGSMLKLGEEIESDSPS
ncbi:THAP domain-containing protein 1 A [Oryzias latipes]|uniref:THAP domain-containing protein 1 A n=1 Tax=Oryzias latipes TaxID=8090 RepID=UPI0000E9D374|nr:THAP domain-containing protein 1 A [Oryzias latipes]